MEHFEPVRNEESNGYSKRRTSILKVPRKSSMSSEVEHVPVVEYPKPSEKRISRRVSFAPANDVVLFSKDAKNPTPLQSPVQDLFSGSATQNRVQMKVIDDQQFTGINALLKAPKQTLQQKDAVGSYSERNFGEKTMIFPADDLDMTPCHTVRITNQEGFMDMSHALQHGQGEKTVIFDRSMEMTMSQTLNMSCDQDMSFSSKSTSSSRFPFTTPMFPGTDLFFNKENLVPTVNRSVIKKMGDANVRTVSLEHMDLTESNPLQCSIYMEPDKPQFQTISTDKKSTSELAIDNYSRRRSIVNFDTQVDGRSSRVNVFSDCTESTLKTNFPRHQMLIASQDVGGERTVCFSVDDACMDETRSHTVKISSDFQLQPNLDSLSGEKTVRFSAKDAGMDMTQCLTVNIARDLFPNSTTQPKQESDAPLPVQNLGLEFENFFASLSGQNLKENTSRMHYNKPFTQSHTETKSFMNDSEMFKGAVEGGGKCVDDETVNMDITDAHIGRMSGDENLYHNIVQTGQTSQLQRSALRTLSIKGTDRFRKSQIQSYPEDFDAEEPVRERTVRFAADEALMDVTRCHTVHISTDLKPELPLLEKPLRCDVDETPMDKTQCHTSNIAKNVVPSLQKDLDLLPKYGEKTVQFNADDDTMDMTRSQTVKIDLPNESFSCLSKKGEKTERFDAAMDVTQCLTVNIATEIQPKLCLAMTPNCLIDPEPQVDGNASSGENNLRFSVDEANLNVTKSRAMMMYAETQMIQDLDTLPRSEDKTVQFSSEDGGMEMTQCLTANIANEAKEFHTDLSPVPISITMDSCSALKKREPSIYTNRRCKSLSRHGLNAALKARRSVVWGNLNKATTGIADEDSNPTETGVENENGGILSIIAEKSIADVSLKEKCADRSLDMNLTEALPVQIQRTSISESHLKDLTPKAEEQTTEDAETECEVEIKVHPRSPQTTAPKADEQDNADKPEPLPTSMVKDGEAVCSRKSRRMSLAEIQSKIRRFSENFSVPDDNVAVDVNIPTPSLDAEPRFEVFKKELLQTDEPDVNVDLEKNEFKSDALDEPYCVPATPFKLETKRLMSRLSVVGFKPKLTRTSKSEETKTLEPTKTLNVQVQNQPGNPDLNISDINDEELGSYEDVSEILDTHSLNKGSEMVTLFELDQELQEVFENEFAHVNEKKRPLEEDYNAEDEKRLRTSKDTETSDSQTCTLECDGNVTTATNTQTTNSSNSSQAARCEATFESTSVQSLFESSLEDYANDFQKKYDKGTLSLMEFFKRFHIDFVIHNSRQSVAPGRSLSDTKSTLMELSLNRHIGLPKQRVYEADVHNLTEQVEGLKVRMPDLEKPLMLINKTVWEEMEHFSEAEYKSFGAKLKERHNFYRKGSKVKSHELKEVLYTELIQANVEEQNKLRGWIEKADTMLTSLDDAIAGLEADLSAIDSSVISNQEELNKITEAVGNNERSTSALEIQTKQSLNRMKKMKEETTDLERHLTMLHTINEWKMEEITSNSVIYTFLYKTLHLELVYEESEGESGERKIVGISFKHLLDEKSKSHTHLVHTLLSQFTRDESLTKKYPTSKHVPELLHDVSLVVSRIRQLGEELRQLKAWGSLRFNILHIHCLHSEIHIMFSSLQKCLKFEVVLSVCLSNQLYALQLKGFTNIIGNTTFQNIEDIVASFSPGHKCLTKMIKNIQSSLLC